MDGWMDGSGRSPSRLYFTLPPARSGRCADLDKTDDHAIDSNRLLLPRRYETLRFLLPHEATSSNNLVACSLTIN